MTKNATFQLDGADQLARLLRQLPNRIDNKIMLSAVRKSANIIKKEAKAKAPVGQGRTSKRGRQDPTPAGTLKKSIIVRRNRRGEKSRKEVRYRIGFKPEAFYGMFVEFGTSKMTARPFLRPAFDSRKGDALRMMTDTAIEGVMEAAERLSGSYRGSGLGKRKKRR